MTPLISNHLKISALLLLIASLSLNVKAQDLHDLEHSLKFANYLFASRQYALSAEEYERVVFLDTTNNTAIFKLLKSYRLANKPKIAEQRFISLFQPQIYDVPSTIGKEYIASLILNKKFAETYDYLEKNTKLEQNYKETYQLASLILQKKRNLAFNYAKNYKTTNGQKNADLHLLAIEYKHAKYKKAWFAAGLSSLVPGAGKCYTKNWSDGILSFLLIGLNAWQAYRGFHKYGSNSRYGWIFAGLTTSFYISNIFGSYKAAKRYNKKLDNEIYDKAWHIIVDDNS